MAQSAQTVLVLGGGIAGLSSALELSNHGWKVVLLEAREHLGGRILSHPSGAGHVELGAEFVHGLNPSLCRLIRKAGLSIGEVPETHWLPGRNGRLQQRDLWSDLERIMRKIDLTKPDRTFANFVRHQKVQKELRQHAIDFVEGFNAADRRRIGIHGLAAAEESSERIEGEKAFRICGGYGLLVHWLAGQLRRRRVRVVWNAVARTIRWQPHAVTIEVGSGSRKQSFVGDAAIVTLPLGVLQSGHVQFRPPLQQKREAIAAMPFGHVGKVVLRFRSRIWPKRDFGFIHSQDEWLPTWWSNDDESLITGWAGGPRGERLARYNHAFIRRRALAALADIFGRTGLGASLVECHFHNWKTDPFSRGAYSYLPVHGLELPSALAAPIADTLFFAGEATDLNYQLGTVHAALESGVRAANEVSSRRTKKERPRRAALY